MKKINLSADRYLSLKARDLALSQIIIGPFGNTSSNALDFMYMWMAFIKQFWCWFYGLIKDTVLQRCPARVKVFWTKTGVYKQNFWTTLCACQCMCWEPFTLLYFWVSNSPNQGPVVSSFTLGKQHYDVSELCAYVVVHAQAQTAQQKTSYHDLSVLSFRDKKPTVPTLLR